MKNIFFHGASVTQQNKEGSYVNELKKLYQREPSINILTKGYGGCHFDDAGFLTLGRDVSEEIDICFLEWNTTSLAKFDEAKLNYVCELLLSKKVMPVFLILAREDTCENDREAERQVISLCDTKGIKLLDYRSLIDSKRHLRDSVHTNSSGGELYAKALKKDIPELIKSYELFIQSLPHIDEAQIEYKINPATCPPFVLKEGDAKEFALTEVQSNAEIVLEVTVGPSSGYVEVNGSQYINFWDQWCHFERPSFKKLTTDKLLENSTLLIRMSERKVDYSSCRRDFKYSGTKTLTVHTVWAINCICKLL